MKKIYSSFPPTAFAPILLGCGVTHKIYLLDIYIPKFVMHTVHIEMHRRERRMRFPVTI